MKNQTFSDDKLQVFLCVDTHVYLAIDKTKEYYV